MAATAPSAVVNRTNAQAWPERLPPRITKTSSTSPCSEKICRENRNVNSWRVVQKARLSHRLQSGLVAAGRRAPHKELVLGEILSGPAVEPAHWHCRQRSSWALHRAADPIPTDRRSQIASCINDQRRQEIRRRVLSGGSGKVRRPRFGERGKPFARVHRRWSGPCNLSTLPKPARSPRDTYARRPPRAPRAGPPARKEFQPPPQRRHQSLRMLPLAAVGSRSRGRLWERRGRNPAMHQEGSLPLALLTSLIGSRGRR